MWCRMSNALVTYALRAVRTAVAAWLATQMAGNVWWTPIIVALGKALRDRFPGTIEKWLPI